MVFVVIVVLIGMGILVWMMRRIRRLGLDRWLAPYVLQSPRRRWPKADEEIHVLLCIADHYEPKQYRPSAEVSRARVRR